MIDFAAIVSFMTLVLCSLIVGPSKSWLKYRRPHMTETVHCCTLDDHCKVLFCVLLSVILPVVEFCACIIAWRERRADFATRSLTWFVVAQPCSGKRLALSAACLTMISTYDQQDASQNGGTSCSCKCTGFLGATLPGMIRHREGAPVLSKNTFQNMYNTPSPPSGAIASGALVHRRCARCISPQ